MKTSYKYLAIAFATLLCSCNEGIIPDMIDSQVQISANITPCVLTRVTEDGTSFTDGDAIKVQNIDRENKNLATYTYSESTGKWATTDELYWDGEDANTFYAWYPATAAYDSFTIPADQTSGTAAADWMTATTAAKKADGTVNLSFNHNLAKVTVTIDSWSNEYSANEKVANALELNSLSSVMSYDGTLSGDNTARWVKAYAAQVNTSFVAIIAPATYASGDDIMQVYVNGSSTPLAVKTSSDLTIEAGKAYGFKLTIGKNLAEITSSVIIGEWDDVELEDQQATAEVIEKIDYIDEYGINHGTGVEIDGVVWAPVNCGYHAIDFKYGKLYQWGRKYGQGFNNTEANFPIFVAGPVFTSEAEDENNADKFFYVLGNTNSAFSYWDFPSLRDVTLWNSGSEEEPIKTIYDPCPDGWRAPTENELKSLFKNKSPMESFGSIKGAWFTGNSPYNQDALSIFIPAAGRRNEYMTCQLRNERVICWSSKYSRYAYYTGNTSSENLIGGYSAYGQSVRCVKETEHDLHSLVVSQNSISIPSGSNSTKFVIESSDVAWSITTDNEDFIVIPSTGTGMAEVEVICHSSPKTQSNLYITTHAKRLSTDRQYVITINRERNDGICYIDDKGYNHGEGIAISGVIWAPVNCGCEEMLSNTQRQGKGLYYQWGRKYGQGAADGSEGPISQVVQGPVAVVTGNSVTNANVFYKSSSNDWAMSSDKNLWNSSSQDNPLKTKYDPCPEGWRVPTSKEFTSLYENYLQGSKNGNLGIFCYGSEECSAYNPSVFLPSSDILSPSTGQLLSGTNLDVWDGSYWTSTRYDIGIYSISFGSYVSGKPHISTIADAAWGRKVRCVSEKSSLK